MDVILPSDETKQAKMFRAISAAVLQLVHPQGENLSSNQVALFLQIYLGNKTLTTSEAACMLGVTGPAISTMVARLCESGYVAKRKDSTDGRLVIIERSPKGISWLANLIKTIEE